MLSRQGQRRFPVAVPDIHVQSCRLQEGVQRQEVVRDSGRVQRSVPLVVAEVGHQLPGEPRDEGPR